MRELYKQAALTISGYLRRKPDPEVEYTLKHAFAELDVELAAILGDRTRSARA